MIYNVTHTTRYRYDQPVSICHNLACLKPRETPNQKLLRHNPVFFPKPTHRREFTDYYGNHLLWFCFQEGYRELSVKSACQVEVQPPAIPDPATTPAWEEVRQLLQQPTTAERIDASQFRYESPRVRLLPQFKEYALKSFTPRRPILAALQELTHRIHQDFEFNSRETDVTTPVEVVFEKKKGVCQDFTHVQLSMLRSLGLAARYVSGYIRTYPVAGQDKLTGADATHAWSSLWCGDAGWIDADPTNDQFLSADHITLAWGRDYTEVSPLRGVYIGGGFSQLTVEVQVTPVE